MNSPAAALALPAPDLETDADELRLQRTASRLAKLGFKPPVRLAGAATQDTPCHKVLVPKPQPEGWNLDPYEIAKQLLQAPPEDPRASSKNKFIKRVAAGKGAKGGSGSTPGSPAAAAAVQAAPKVLTKLKGLPTINNMVSRLEGWRLCLCAA